MQNSQLYPDIIAALGIEHLSENDQFVFLSEHGDTIFVEAINRLDALLTEPEQLEVQTYLETDPEPEVLIDFLLNKFQIFSDILRAVATETSSQI